MKTFYAILIIVVLALGAYFLLIKKVAAPQTSTPQTQTPSSQPAVSAPAPNPTAAAELSADVSIKNFQFNPALVTIKKSGKVTWTNNDITSHTVTGNRGGPASQILTPGQSYTFQFNAAGIFDYHCSIHPSMSAEVIVTE